MGLEEPEVKGVGVLSILSLILFAQRGQIPLCTVALLVQLSAVPVIPVKIPALGSRDITFLRFSGTAQNP